MVKTTKEAKEAKEAWGYADDVNRRCGLLGIQTMSHACVGLTARDFCKGISGVVRFLMRSR
jgi:hypothetical protein